jgi:hypothetical protein
LRARLRIAAFRDRAEVILLLNEFGDEASPAGLIRGAETGVAVKVLVEQIARLSSVYRGSRWLPSGANSVPYRRLSIMGALERPLAFVISQPKLDQPIAEAVPATSKTLCLRRLKKQ